MTNSEFDLMMQEHYAIIVEQAAMRRLVDECTDREFIEEYFLDRLCFFKQGHNAKEFFENNHATYLKLRNLKRA